MRTGLFLLVGEKGMIVDGGGHLKCDFNHFPTD